MHFICNNNGIGGQYHYEGDREKRRRKEEKNRDMLIKIFQKGFNYSQDGSGNRIILHLQGCNMRCPWCSNPEGLSLHGTLMTESDWLDDSCCPRGAVRNKTLDRIMCENCEEKECITKRRQKGITWSCHDYEIDEIVKECVAAKPMFFDGGGVTLTGGEISLQFEAVKELLQKLGEHGIHRAIECNGSNTRMEELVPLVEQWIMDVKHYDPVKHKQWIGVSNRQTLKNMKKISAVHPNVLLRVPLIPDFNDSKEDADGFADLFEKNLSRENTKIEFLIYHEFGKVKWEQCGLEYTMPPRKIAPGTREYFEKKMEEKGLTCIRT